MKAGKIYREAARRYLIKYYPCMGTAEREALLENDLEEIEDFVGISKLLEAGILTIWDDSLPGNVMDVVLYSENPEKDLQEAREIVTKLSHDDAKKSSIALTTMSAVYNKWLRAKAVAEKRSLWQISLVNAFKFYEIIRPFLDVMGIAPSTTALVKAYFDGRRKEEQKE